MTTTTVAERLAAFMTNASNSDPGVTDAIHYLFGDTNGVKSDDSPLHEPLSHDVAGAISLIARLTLGEGQSLELVLAGLLMRQIALGYAFREAELRRAIETEAVEG